MLIDKSKIDELKNIPHRKDGNLLNFCLKHLEIEFNDKVNYIRNMDVENDCKKIEQDLHYFKSSCLNIGAIELANTCQSIITCTRNCAKNAPECLGKCQNAGDFENIGKDTVREIKNLL